MLTVRAPDQIGLLWSICHWLAEDGSSIEAAHIGTDAGMVRDHFVVVGAPDPAALAALLTGRSGPGHGQVTELATRASGLAANATGLAVHAAGMACDAVVGALRRLRPY